MKRIILSLVALVLIACGSNRTENVDPIFKAVERQMQNYPESTLRDVYKSFFQDRFGPGHIVSDTTAAANYLRHELATAEHFGGAPYEPTGSCGNFYRVNLSLVKDSIIDYQTFFDAFLRSVDGIEMPTVEVWTKEWHAIVNIISRMDNRPANFAADSITLENILKEGHYAVHHSREYNVAYHPHYRIIHKDIFEKELLPLIEKVGR